jgi:hypothetical protein
MFRVGAAVAWRKCNDGLPIRIICAAGSGLVDPNRSLRTNSVDGCHA